MKHRAAHGLRHIENHLEAAPGTGVSLMDPKETSSGLWKSNKKGVAQCSLSRAQRVECPGSVSPLKNSSLNNSLQKTASVDVKEPLSTYRELSPRAGLPLQLEDQTGLSQMVFQRDTRYAQTIKPASTLSSMVSDTSVHYLNDQLSLNVAREPVPLLATTRGAISYLSTQDQQPSQGLHQQMESLQNSSPNCTSQRLESLRRQQTDNKLEKLKERIRRQREHLEEAADKKELLGSVEKPVGRAQLNLESSKAVQSAHVRKVITAPPAPVYKGFNTSEIKNHSADVKTCQEDLTRLRREIYRDLTRQLTGEGTRTTARCRERSKGKKSVKPIRKVHRSGPVADSDPRPASTSTSTWREGQKLVKMILGPPLQPQPKSSPGSGDLVVRTGGMAHPSNSSLSDNLNQAQKNENGKTAAVHLSADIQDILDDLELDTAPRKHVEKLAKKTVTPRVTKTKDYDCVDVNLTASPARSSSKEALKPDQVRRKRHYDSAAVRQYISRQQVERRRRQTEERRSQQEETERRNQRLQELYRKQKESFNKTTAAAPAPTVKSTPRCLLETYTKLLPEQTQLEADILFAPFTSPHQQRPLYQPSNESDKENKHQNRPQSASSGDISVSEQQPPILRNELGLPTRSSYVQGNGQCSSLRGDVAVPPVAQPTQTFPQWLGKEYKHSTPSATCLHVPVLPNSLTTMTSRMSRLEVLKSTATSLSNRIENEARKLLLTCKGSQLCVSELGVDLPDHLARMGSSNINAVTKPEHSEEKILKLHCTDLTTYDGTLPGVGNLYTFREPQEKTGDIVKDLIPSCIADFKQKEGNIDQAEEQQSMFHHGHLSSNSSSISDDHLTERKASSQQSSMRVTVLDIDCIQQESTPLHQISVLSSGTDKCKLFTSAVPQDASTAAWKELTKGSPHSVINIFTKHLPNNSNKVVSNRRSERFSPISSTGHPEGHQDNNLTSPGTNSSGQQVILNPNRHSSSSAGNKQGSSPKDDSKSLKSGIQSFSPVGSQVSSFCSAADSLDMEASVDVKLVKGQDDDWSAGTEPRSLGSIKEGSKGNSPHSSLKGLDTDSTTGAASVYSSHSLFVHSKTSQRTAVCSSADSEPPSTSKGSVDKEGVKESSTPSWALHSTSAISQGNTGPLPSIHAAELVVNTAGGLQCAPGALQQRMAAELMYLDSIEESIRQLSDVERIRGVSLAQQEALSLAHVLKSQQQVNEQHLHQLNLKTGQDLESQMELENAQQRETQITSTLSIRAPITTSHCDDPQYTFLIPTSSSTVSVSSGSGAQVSASLSFEQKRSVLEDAQENFVPSDSIPSPQDDRDSLSVATEYSLKFDESMTEDEIEERSFRSLLPSESHRRGTLERKASRHEESEEEPAQDLAISLDTSKQENSIPFSSGQNSFSRFTMEMVRQYMKEEEVRAQHQSSLLQLRQRALKEKTRAELAWLEHLKKRLRDKGEDDKMPPIRKKQRVLLLKLQQEQAEIKRLQEANKAARKERQLLLKQQEEIERMHTTTLRLRERLKSACHLEPSSLETMEEPVLSNMTITDANSRSTSPLSVSGSETSSILQRLKKMHSHMDEKFLTKREQQLKQRRSYAEELLQWKQRLDFEEREIRRMERQAMAVWDRDMPEVIPHQNDDVENALTELSKYSGPSDLPSSEKLMEHPQLSQSHLSSPLADATFSQESDTSQRILSPSGKTISSPSHRLENSTGDSVTVSSTSLRQISSDQMSSMKKSESDQNGIESRIYALKEELRKRKTVVHQLKKEQKKRQREQLKAQEANLLKQLESYNDFIKKTKSELSKDQGCPSIIKPEVKKLATERTGMKPSPPQRSETSNYSQDGTIAGESDKNILIQVNREVVTSYEITKSALSHEESLSDEDPPTVTPTPVLGSPDLSNSLVFSESKPKHTSHELSTAQSGSENILSCQKAEETTDVDSLKSEKLQTDHSHVHLSDVLLRPELLAEPDVDKMHSLSSSDLAEESCRVNDPNTASKLKLQDDTSNCTDDVKTTPSLPNQIFSGEHKTCSQAESSSDRQQSYVPINVPESQLKGKQVSSSLTYGYNDDFESLAESSLITMGKKSINSYLEDQRKSLHKSVTNTEDEIVEELSSETKSISDLQSEHLLDLKNQTGKPTEPVEGEDLISTISTESSASNSQVLSEVDKMDDFSIGDRVLVQNLQLGTLRFKGQTSFAKGFWAGVELDKSEGSNNGTCDGVVYFECKPAHGVFVSPSDVSHLPEVCNIDVNTTDDEDSFFDDMSHKDPLIDTSKDQLQQQGQVADDIRDGDHKDKGRFDQTNGSCDLESLPTTLNKDFVALLNRELPINNVTFDHSKDGKCSLISGERTVTNLDCISTDNQLSLPSSVGKSNLKMQVQEAKPSAFHDSLDNEKLLTDTKICADEKYDILSNSENVKSTFADQLFKNFVTDAVKQFQQIQKAKHKKIEDANLRKDDYGDSTKTGLTSLNIKMDKFPLFDEEEDITSPELYNRQESPVLDASGQQELAKRLAELELSRELLEALGDEPDWFDEDFGLSSRKEQRQKHLHLWQEQGISGTLGSGPIQQVKTPPRPELPLRSSTTPEKQVMIVPHGALEMEKLVYAATQEIWDKCKLGMDKSLTGCPRPKASVDFLGGEATTEDQDAYCKQSYKQAVFDLSWEVIKDIYAKDHNAEQPQWMKPQRIKSSYFHGLKCIENIQTVQSFITEEVLKLYGLKREQNQKTDWQKMLKFGRKKRDRVDHILVQELHDEESLWVNYDEDELYVKMQLADGIFDALLKDTEDVLSQIQEKRLSRAISS